MPEGEVFWVSVTGWDGWMVADLIQQEETVTTCTAWDLSLTKTVFMSLFKCTLGGFYNRCRKKHISIKTVKVDAW